MKSQVSFYAAAIVEDRSGEDAWDESKKSEII